MLISNLREGEYNIESFSITLAPVQYECFLRPRGSFDFSSVVGGVNREPICIYQYTYIFNTHTHKKIFVYLY